MSTPALMVIAHRGASSYAPENTFAAFDLALQMGARHIELDVQLTSDGHIVVIHDDSVDRTTNGSGLVAGYTLAALRKLDAGSWFGAKFTGEYIPLFDEVLARYKGLTHIHTEIKDHSPYISQSIVDLIRKYGMEKQVTITSFQQLQLEEIRIYAPELPTGWLVAKVNNSIINQARAMGLSQICPLANTMTPELVACLHANGFLAVTWGVATKEIMQLVIKTGADGMTVNFPDKLIAYLKRHKIQWE